MKKRVKIAIGFVIVVVIACIAGFINAWIITGGLKMSDLTGDTQKITEKLWVEKILITETKGGKKYWEIFGKSGQYVDGQEKVLLNGVIGNFYNDKGEVILSFAGDKGEYQIKNKKVTLQGHSKLAGKDDTYMDTDKITWEGEDGIIHADGHIRAVKSDQVLITCDKAVVTTNFKDFKIYGHTKTQIYEKGAK